MYDNLFPSKFVGTVFEIVLMLFRTSALTHTQKRSNTIFEAANYVHDRYQRIHVASNNKWDEIRTTNDKYFVLFINILMFRVFK